VIITGRIPASTQVRTAAFASGRGSVDHPDQPQERQLAPRVVDRRPPSAGDRQDAQRLARQLPGRLEERLATRLVEGGLARRRQLPRAGLDDDLGRALRIRDAAVRRLVDRGHALRLGRERDLVHARELREEVRPVQAGLRGGHDQRRLGRVAANLPLVAGLAPHKLSVRCEHGGAQRLDERCGGLDGRAVPLELPCGS
jgi:hypothetical protein